MLDFISTVCTLIVSVQVLKIVYNFLYNQVIAPAIAGNPDLKKMGKWAVITGATDGVGKAYAEALAQKGMDIVLISRSVEKLENVALELQEKYKVETKIIEADFSEGNKIYSNIEKELYGLDIGVLVNNVGVSYPYPDYFLELKGKEKIYYDIIQCNIVSVLAMCQIVMPGMVERKKGVVINISSATALFPSPLLAVYGSSKMFVSKFSEDLATEYGKRGIIVQCILPGYVATKMSKIKKPSLFSPSPKTFVESALKTVGIESHTVGYWPHNIMPGILASLYSFSSKLVSWTVMNQMLQIRTKALKHSKKSSD
ncbi:very-long-chain 3-oxoacyl-CoA reductase [Planococcus citri]|uniref:very-long-chain 3-oxoacyl-CoA reductase n=1 Tax=Planococcus citri TaxID=170843 RepID=UPI0031F79EB7